MERLGRTLTQAEGYLDLELHDMALKQLATVPVEFQQQHVVVTLTAEALRAGGRFQEALPLYELLTRRKSADVGDFVGLGWCLKRMGKLRGASAAMKAGLDRHPASALLHYNLACYRSLQKLHRWAYESLDRAFELEPGFSELAPHESDFDAIKDKAAFQKLVELAKARSQAKASPPASANPGQALESQEGTE